MYNKLIEEMENRFNEAEVLLQKQIFFLFPSLVVISLENFLSNIVGCDVLYVVFFEIFNYIYRLHYHNLVTY